MIGRHINVVLNWMIARLQGQSDFQILLDDSLTVAQGIISERLAQKIKHEKELARQKRELEFMQQAEQEAKDYLNALALKEALKQQEAIEKPQLKSTIKQAVVTKVKSKIGNKKRANIVKMTDSIKSASTPKTPALKTPKQTAIKEEAKIEEDFPSAQVVKEEEVPIPKFIELPSHELMELKSKILTQTYQLFIDTY